MIEELYRINPEKWIKYKQKTRKQKGKESSKKRGGGADIAVLSSVSLVSQWDYHKQQRA